MKNYKELLFTIKTSPDCEKGGFDYKHFTPEKDGDVVETFKYIDIVGKDKIQILEVKRIVSNLKIYGENHIGYSSHDERKILNEYKFKELTKSEYWEQIKERYNFDEKKYKIYALITENEQQEKDIVKYKSLYENEKDKNDTLVRIVKKIEEEIKKHLNVRDYSNHKYELFGREYFEESFYKVFERVYSFASGILCLEIYEV